jgi:putative ABC transport system permease protein
MRLIDETIADLRFATRLFKRAPGFTLVAFVTLVVGVATVTSVFSYLDAVYFAALPYKDADRVVALNERRPRSFYSYSAISIDAIRLVQRASRSFERVAAYREGGGTATFGTTPRMISTLYVDSAFLPLFDLRPEVGRRLSPEEISAGSPVLMIADQLWRAEYGADPGAIGKLVTIGSHSYTIVGVLPPGFRFPYRTDALSGLATPSDSVARLHDRAYAMIGKLHSGVTRDAARAELQIIARQLPTLDKAYAEVRLEVRDEMVDRRGRAFLPTPGLFLGAALFVLLIACANVANLFLVRAAERRSEMAIRASLGAARLRLIRQTLVETLLLGITAAVCGTAAAGTLVRLGLHFIPTTGFPSWFHVAIDYRVLAFAVGVTVLATITVGLMPALEGTRIDLVGALKRGGDGGTAASGIARASRRGAALQVALSVTLFTGAALLVRSYQRLTRVDFGYPADRIAVVQPLFDPARYAELSSRSQFADAIVGRARGLPGSTTVALRGAFWRLRTTPKPASSDSPSAFDDRLIPDRDTTQAVKRFEYVESVVVGDDYFSLVNLRMRVGRNFAADDIEGATPVSVVSASVAKAVWPSSRPIGHTIQVGAKGDALTVIGVVDDIREIRGGPNGFGNAVVPKIYLSTRQAFSGYPQILVTGRGDVIALRSHVVDLVRSADPAMILFDNETTLANQADQALLVTRVFGGLIGVFAVSGLLLSIVGIYGVVAFGVARRTREIGIRIALGGTSADVMRVVMTDGARFVTLGIALGLLLSTAFGRLINVFLFGVSSLDPVAYAAVVATFALVAMAACWWPARRVTKVDPLIALRAD